MSSNSKKNNEDQKSGWVDVTRRRSNNDKNHDWFDVIRSASGDIRRLSSVWRFSSIPVVFHENTAEHSFWVALYALIIHKEVNPEDNWLIGPICAKAISHDIPECVTGDIVRPFKYSTPELKQEVDRAERILFQKLPLRIKEIVDFDFNPLFGEETSLYIDTVVKAADFLSLYQYMTREAVRGNHDIESFYHRMINDLKEMAKKSHMIRNFDAISFYEALSTESYSILEKFLQK
jgi:5'-deoxynucleotidase YfbR-like HD superfamily hydrolase